MTRWFSLEVESEFSDLVVRYGKRGLRNLQRVEAQKLVDGHMHAAQDIRDQALKSELNRQFVSCQWRSTLIGRVRHSCPALFTFACSFNPCISLAICHQIAMHTLRDAGEKVYPIINNDIQKIQKQGTDFGPCNCSCAFLFGSFNDGVVE